jgi:hypothetical protein
MWAGFFQFLNTCSWKYRSPNSGTVGPLIVPALALSKGLLMDATLLSYAEGAEDQI